MSQAIVTPLTQALAEGKLSRAELKSFMQRSDAQAYRRLALWILMLAITTAGVALAWNSCCGAIPTCTRPTPPTPSSTRISATTPPSGC